LQHEIKAWNPNLPKHDHDWLKHYFNGQDEINIQIVGGRFLGN
jgi:hypothetical protein